MANITCTTMEEAMKAESASIGSIAVQNKNTAVALLTILIGELVLYFNVGKTMGVPQIKITIDMLLSDLTTKNLKPEHYKVCFENMKKGYYGSLYDRFDGQIIFKILCEYADKLASLIEVESMRKAEIDKAKPIIVSKELLKVYIDAKKEIDTKIISPKGEKKFEPKNPEVTKIFAEFDEEYKKNPVRTKIGRFIKYEGKEVDQIEYLERRLGIYKKKIEENNNGKSNNI